MAKANRICSIAGCGKPAKARSLCQTHYMRLLRHGSPEKGAAPVRGVCSLDGCNQPHGAKGLCKLHFDRWARTGDPGANTPARTSPGERLKWLSDHVDYQGDECLIWPYSRDHNGYGRVKVDGANTSASRWMAFLKYGEPPAPEYQSAHECGKGHLGCVNPKHLRWDTAIGNIADRERHGTQVRGRDCHTSKLSEHEVLEIRALGGTMSQQSIADVYGISQTTAGKIIRRATWAWLS